jgi:hypothetical protein
MKRKRINGVERQSKLMMIGLSSTSMVSVCRDIEKRAGNTIKRQRPMAACRESGCDRPALTNSASSSRTSQPASGSRRVRALERFSRYRSRNVRMRLERPHKTMKRLIEQA